MKFKFLPSALISFTLLTIGHLPARAQAPTPPAAPTPPPAPTASASTEMGTVTAIDTTANTITIHDRRSDTDVVVAVNGDTKYTKIATVAFSTLAVGNVVSMFSPDYSDGDTTITTNRLLILPALPTETAGQGVPAQYRPVVGTITTLTPALTITTPNKTVITVTTTPDVEVLTNVPGTISDITVGLRVRATGTSDGTTLTATLVAAQPARPRRPTTN